MKRTENLFGVICNTTYRLKIFFHPLVKNESYVTSFRLYTTSENPVTLRWRSEVLLIQIKCETFSKLSLLQFQHLFYMLINPQDLRGTCFLPSTTYTKGYSRSLVENSVYFSIGLAKLLQNS